MKRRMLSLPPKIRAWFILVLLTGPLAGPLLAEGKIEPPVPVRTAAPDVPAEFVQDGRPGLVTVNFIVDEQGAVQDPKVEKTTSAMLDHPAVQAVKKWKFRPARKDGVPFAMRVSIPIRFDID